MDTIEYKYSEKPSEKQPDPTKPEDKGWLRKCSNVLSAVFSPIMIPTYAYAIALLTTPLSLLSTRITVISTVIVFVITALAPLSFIIWMMRKGRISDPSISNRKERFWPYLLTIFSYMVVAYLLMRFPPWVPGFFVGAAVAAIIASLINTRWKISAHMTAMGGLTALLVFIGLAHLAVVMIIPWISNAILLSGAVGTARLYLKRHTSAQVFSGWILGFAVTTVCVWFF